MATVLTECTIKEQRAVERFLWEIGLPAKRNQKEMLTVYADKCLSRKAVHNKLIKILKDALKLLMKSDLVILLRLQQTQRAVGGGSD
jgi:hypothetical protein